MQNSTRECEAQEKQKITHMQNLASQLQNYIKLINCLNFSKIASITVPGGKLFHYFIADGKKECKWQSTLDSGLVMASSCCVYKVLVHCWVSVSAG